MSSQVRLTATVTGRVQGVGFRFRTRRQARRLGLTGEAANRKDGSVQVIAEGDREAVDSLLEWLQSRDAPGRVAHVDAAFTPATGKFSGWRAHRRRHPRGPSPGPPQG